MTGTEAVPGPCNLPPGARQGEEGSAWPLGGCSRTEDSASQGPNLRESTETLNPKAASKPVPWMQSAVTPANRRHISN